MKTQVCIAALLTLVLTVGAYAQKGTVSRLGPSKAVHPLRMAMVGPDLKQVTPWVPYSPPGANAAVNWQVAYDLFESDDANGGVPFDGKYNTTYGLGSDRWFFAPGYLNPFICNDMQLAPGTAGRRAQRCQFAWFWDPPGPERCIIIIVTAEDFSNTGTPPSFTNPYAGVVYDLGVLNPDTTTFKYSDNDLTGGQLFHQLPGDGQGAVVEYILKAYDGQTGQMTPATSAQPMLWGTKRANGGTNPSTNTKDQWDDDNPTDLTHTSGEFYDYTYDVCPDPLGAMVALSVVPAPTSVPPNAVRVFRGNLESGGLAEILNSDNTYLVVRNGVTALRTESPITVDCDYTSPTQTVGSMTARWENRVSITGLEQRLEMKNQTTGSFVQLDRRTASSGADLVVNANVANPNDYITTGTKLMQTRHRVNPSGPVFTNTWRAFMDQMVILQS